MLEPASSPGQKSRKDKGRVQREVSEKEREGLQGFGQIDQRERERRMGQNDGEKDTLFTQLLWSFHHQLSYLRPMFHVSLPLSALSNEWQ